MLIRVPDYYDRFRCLAGDCPHSCCIGWEVVLDGETAARYRREPDAFGRRLRAAMERDADGDVCFPLRGGRCPFLDGENLCEIHRRLGEDSTSVTCREHPRFTEDYGAFREITLSAACPAAGTLLLSGDEPLAFRETETAEPAEAGDDWLPCLLPLRARLLAILQDRAQTLSARLDRFLRLADRAQTLLDADRPEALAALEDTPTPPAVPGEAALLPAALALLTQLDILEADWRALLTAAAERPTAPGTASAAQLERIAAYLAFRYLLKTVNDGDLLSRAKLCVFAVLLLDRLSALCPLPEALRLFSRELEHDGDNLDALLEFLAADRACALPAFRQAAAALRF